MRTIGEVDDPTIKDAEELYVYLFREDRFRLVRRDKFPRTKCLICPKKYHKTYNISVPCKFKTNSWSMFKAHIQRSEKIYGELIAFPANCKRLPDVSIYHKSRLYGITSEFQTKDKFYLFDLKQKQFIHVERQSLRKMYIHNNYCNYCLCGKSVISSSTFISHLSTLESTYYCYLILDHLEENDEKNQRRIDVLVRDFEKRKLKSTRIRANTNIDALMASVVANSTKSTEELRDELSDDELSSEIDESKLEQLDRTSNSATEDRPIMLFVDPPAPPPVQGSPVCDKSLVSSEIDQKIVPRNELVVQMESTMKKNFDEMQNIIQKLQSEQAAAYQPDLLTNLLKDQASLLLTKRVENYQTKAHHLSFSKKINVTANDLNDLLTRYSISNKLCIERAEISLNLVMKDEFGLNIESLDSAAREAIEYSTNVKFNGSYETSAEFDAKAVSPVNQNSAAHSSLDRSLYFDCPESKYSASNGNDKHAACPPATNRTNSSPPSNQTSTNHQFDSKSHITNGHKINSHTSNGPTINSHTSNSQTINSHTSNGHTSSDSNDHDSDGLEDVSDGDESSSEEMVTEPIKPPKPSKPEPKPEPVKCPLDQSLSNLAQSKLSNFKIPKKPKINSFGHFASSSDIAGNNDQHWSNGDLRSSPLRDHSYKSSSSYYRGRYY